MIYLKPKTEKEMLSFVNQYKDFFIFCGGTDLTLKLKKQPLAGVIDI